MSFVFVSKDFAEKLRAQLKKEGGDWEQSREELRRRAEEALHKGPWSVTFHPSPAASGNPHDFYTEGLYWWPDPNNPEGPYIRRDGERNPDQFTAHRTAFTGLKDALVDLCSAGYYLEEKKYLEKAVYFMKVFFIDPETRMNPHLEYGQAIKGICEGRGIGIIDLLPLVGMVHALGFIEEYPEWKNELDGMKQWVREMLIWLTTSPKGLEEKHNGNNHTTWWCAQVAAYAAFVGEGTLLEEMFTLFQETILPEQMAPDGSFPEETARTLSFHYSLYNLDACAVICQIANGKGRDLWHFTTPDGRGMERAIRFMVPYLDDPSAWKYPQIQNKPINENLAVQLAGLHLSMEECGRVNRKLRENSSHPAETPLLGPLTLLPGYRRL